MRVARSIGAIMALFLSLITATSLVAASGLPTAIPPVLEIPTDQLTPDDLRSFVELALSNTITVKQARDFLGKLSPDQRRLVMEITASQINARRTAGGASGSASAPPTALNAPTDDYFETLIENTYIQGRTSPDWWYQSTYTCDPYDDTDYVFHFNFPSYNPDALGWDTDLPSLYLALQVRGGTDLKGWGYLNGNTVSLCIGDWSVVAGGGADNVGHHIWLNWQ
jgi:hypothetical protein